MKVESCHLAFRNHVLAKVGSRDLCSLDVNKLHGNLIWCLERQDFQVWWMTAYEAWDPSWRRKVLLAKWLLILSHLRSPLGLVWDVVLVNFNHFGLNCQNTSTLSVELRVLLINCISDPCVTILSIIETDHSWFKSDNCSLFILGNIDLLDLIIVKVFIDSNASPHWVLSDA